MELLRAVPVPASEREGCQQRLLWRGSSYLVMEGESYVTREGLDKWEEHVWRPKHGEDGGAQGHLPSMWLDH